RARPGDRAARARPTAVAAVPGVRQIGPHGRPRALVRARRAGARIDPPAHASDARAGVHGAGDLDRPRHSGRAPRRAQAGFASRPPDHDRLDLRLLAAELLARADADPAVRGRTAGAPGRWARRDTHGLRHRVVVPDRRWAA